MQTNAPEFARPVFANGFTMVDITGQTETREAYNITMTRSGFAKGSTFRVSWNVQTLEAACITRTVRMAYWRKGGWKATFSSEKAATEFAAKKLETLRIWAAKRGASAAA